MQSNGIWRHIERRGSAELQTNCPGQSIAMDVKSIVTARGCDIKLFP
jgi:hypothetical protein